MLVYINGVVLEARQPEPMYKKDGSPVLDKSGVQMYRQLVVLQHEFQSQTGQGYNKYIAFEVVASSKYKRISEFAFRDGEEVEVGLSMDSTLLSDGRWFNNFPSCLKVERDKQNWHRAVIQRVATAPAAMQAPAAVSVPTQPQYAHPAPQNFPPSQGSDLPF